MTCCARPAVEVMDYKWPMFASPEDQVQKINRVCVHCFAHWFGVEGDVRKYTKQEWDAWINEAFSPENI